VSGYVLSCVRPDRIADMDHVPTVQIAAFSAARTLGDLGVAFEGKDMISDELLRAPVGTELTHESSGYTFRIDSADNPPNICSCCEALVRPGDHAMAGTEDAHCLGCFTWDRNTPACLPANTAHPEGYDPDEES